MTETTATSHGTPAAGVAAPAAEQSDDAATAVVSLYVKQKKIYARAVSGWFAGWRWAFVWATQLVFYGLPWLQWNDRQAVLFDLGARRFYIFGLVLYPQDFIYLTALLIISAYSLFLFTAVAGRLWCGFACPQTVYTEIFMWVERKIQGDRIARMKRDEGPWNVDRIWRAVAKQAAWIAIALWTGFTFVGYFTPIKTLAHLVSQFGLGPWETFWVFFYGFATYGNAGFMREQVCKYMCPYARFQSAMFDKDTLIVGYDPERGEPRGSRSRKADRKAIGKGDCIDCGLCVQVCPTGIDIRKGLQYECIACAACIDACDEVMDKVGYPRGLIRYDTQRGLEGHAKRIVRPRTIVYATLLALLTAGFAWSITHRNLAGVDVLRDRNALYRELADGAVENVYVVKIMNKDARAHEFTVTATGVPGLSVNYGSQPIWVGAGQLTSVPVRIRVPRDAVKGGVTLHVEIRSVGEPSLGASAKARFLAPTN